eukprot:scaffold23612_cov14-Prasinocladus_malaysianus.AAC.1
MDLRTRTDVLLLGSHPRRFRSETVCGLALIYYSICVSVAVSKFNTDHGLLMNVAQSVLV